MRYCLLGRVLSLIVIGLAAGSLSVHAAEFPDSKGRDFWLSFMPNWHNNENELANDPALQREHQLYVYIGAERPTKGKVTWRRNDGSILVDTFTISDVRQIIRLSKYYQNIELRGINASGAGNLNYFSTQNETIALQSIHVEADDDVTVYALNQAALTSEAFMVLPTDALSEDYMVVAYNSDVRMSGSTPNANSTPSQFVVVATEDSTIIDITPSVPTVKNRVKDPVQIILNQGESYLVQADPRTGVNNDLTGSLVRGNKPIAVFGGQQRAVVPYQEVQNLGSRDCLIEQMTPIRTWGKSAYVTPFAKSSNEVATGTDLYRVVAAFDSTNVYVDGQFQQMLMRGWVLERPLTAAHLVTTSNPTITVQYKKTSGIGGGADITRRGDPAMMLVPPAEQFMNKYRFISIQAYIYGIVAGRVTPIDSVYLEQWLNVVIPTVSLGSLTLDGVPVDQTQFLPIGSSAYSWARLPMRDGVHEIQADTNFGIYVYGYGDANSYGYIGGMSFRPLDVYPPKLVGNVECHEFKGAITDSLLGDSHIQSYIVLATPATNTTYTAGAFAPPQSILPLSISLINPFLDGSAVIEATDMVEQKEQFTVVIPGFTLGITGAKEDTTKQPFRRYVVPIGRSKCDSFEIENYGKYPQTLATITFPSPLKQSFPQLPITLQPGERVVVRYCHTGTQESVFGGRIAIGDSCITRNIMQIEVEERGDKIGPKVLDDRDSCLSEYSVTIDDEIGSDLGLESARILDSVLVNCTVVMTDSTIISRRYRVSIIDPYKDAVVGFEALDSAGNVTRRIDTIPGFNMTINGSSEIVQTYDFGIKMIGSVYCDTLELENLGIRGINLPFAYLKNNTIYSLPQSQFELQISPLDGKASLVVCYAPVLADSIRYVKDTLEFRQYCLVRTLILVGRSNGLEYEGLSRCDVPVSMISRKVGALLVSPQPASDEIVLALGQNVSSCTVSLVDVSGQTVFTKHWEGASTTALRMHVTDVPPGTYALVCTSDSVRVVPLVIVR